MEFGALLVDACLSVIVHIGVRESMERSGTASFSPELDQPLARPPASIRCIGKGEGSRVRVVAVAYHFTR